MGVSPTPICTTNSVHLVLIFLLFPTRWLPVQRTRTGKWNESRCSFCLNLQFVIFHDKASHRLRQISDQLEATKCLRPDQVGDRNFSIISTILSTLYSLKFIFVLFYERHNVMLTYLCFSFFNQTILKLSDTTIPAATIIMFSYFSHKPHGL